MLVGSCISYRAVLDGTPKEVRLASEYLLENSILAHMFFALFVGHETIGNIVLPSSIVTRIISKLLGNNYNSLD